MLGSGLERDLVVQKRQLFALRVADQSLRRFTAEVQRSLLMPGVSSDLVNAMSALGHKP
jgi:hypothetical protein